MTLRFRVASPRFRFASSEFLFVEVTGLPPDQFLLPMGEGADDAPCHEMRVRSASIVFEMAHDQNQGALRDVLGIRYTRSLIPAESRGQLQQGNLIYDLRIIRLMYECALESSTRPLFIATGFVFATDHQLLVSEFVDGRAGFRRQDFAEFGGDPVFHQGGQLLSV